MFLGQKKAGLLHRASFDRVKFPVWGNLGVGLRLLAEVIWDKNFLVLQGENEPICGLKGEAPDCQEMVWRAIDYLSDRRIPVGNLFPNKVDAM